MLLTLLITVPLVVMLLITTGIFKRSLTNITLAKLISALFTITVLAAIKYAITGNIHIDPSHFFTNIGVGLLAFTIKTIFTGLLSEYMDLKGINLNLKELMFGYEKIQVGDHTPPKVSDKLNIKVYLPMNSDEQSNAGSQDKGKGVEYTQSLSAGARAFSGRDPSSFFLPKTNPGPGFNVPGGEVPIREDVCKHISYNTHILKQFKTMDLETAVEQRNNLFHLIKNMDNRMSYAQNFLNGQPTIPTNIYQLNLRNQILKDLQEMHNIKSNAEGRWLLINSRVEFIENKLGKT
ncbi:hypothetical protein (mitochondrion) [Glarea lozoyensis 74030]|uniref:Uncharacterized protein n=2 Tax=Glarea lozoyensis TaxID=101852 RepID=R9UTB8_GLAL7|nr:hypothetical protein [Glarea lozoyensis]AGN74486.1 hypothetical protein [Glarea lozoyensis 74030]AOQ30906.1 hypothetical protein [Glarea lozoyensis]